MSQHCHTNRKDKKLCFWYNTHEREVTHLKQTLCWSGALLNLIENQQKIHETIQSGHLVIFPTETVYGIGANALDPQASKRIYQAKGRPSDNPLIVHISNKEDVYQYVRFVSETAETLMAAFWPGPLTLIFEKNERIPLETTGGLSTVAIRLPSNPIARQVIDLAGVPIAAPSANISGKPSSTLFQHVFDDFNGRVDIIIDGGPSEIGLESTVIDMTSEIPTILRPGFITKKMIESALNMPIYDLSDTKPTGNVKSPGMKYTHYKPKGDVTILKGDIEAMRDYVRSHHLNHPNQTYAVICESEYVTLFDVPVRALGSVHDQKEMAHNLFAALRDMDLWAVDYIFIHHLSTDDLGYALMNRLEKAAGYQIIEL